MNESKRQQKVSRQLQKDLSAILKKRIADNLRDALVTITRVQISPDLSVAKVYISTFSVQNDQDVMALIDDQKSEIRGALGRQIGKQVRIIPELIFVEDNGAQHASDIDDLLSNLHIPPPEE
jgi:ribosome-binding factor A